MTLIGLDLVSHNSCTTGYALLTPLALVKELNLSREQKGAREKKKTWYKQMVGSFGAFQRFAKAYNQIFMMT